MSRFVVVGAGTIGSLVAEGLAAQGHRSVLVSRRGGGPRSPFIENVSADATDAAAMVELASGASAIFNCANPQYHRWITDWPPIAASLQHAAQLSAATLVTLSNLYAYGRPTGPMTPESPFNATYAKAQVRATMWTDALRAHNDGLLRATEVRASDFIGPHAQGVFGERLIPRIMAGKSCQVLGRTDQLHSWTYVRDTARTLIVVAQSELAWGRAWHVPTNPARTQRQVIDDLADTAGVERVRVRTLPRLVLRGAGLFNPLIRELPKTLYQFSDPFVIDDTQTREQFHLEPTDWGEILSETIRAYRDATRGAV